MSTIAANTGQGRRSPALSREYKAALRAQLDYDSTRESQKMLTAALKICTDEDKARHLNARQVSGLAVRRFRREQAALLPPAIKRGQPKYKERSELVNARDDLAFKLGAAAAESDLWGKPSPATTEELFALALAVQKADIAVQGEGARPTQHPEWHSHTTQTAPWLGGPNQEVNSGDAAILVLLRIEAIWHSEQKVLTATGDLDAAWRWGYVTAPTEDKAQFTRILSAPAIAKWYTQQAKAAL